MQQLLAIARFCRTDIAESSKQDRNSFSKQKKESTKVWRRKKKQERRTKESVCYEKGCDKLVENGSEIHCFDYDIEHFLSQKLNIAKLMQ